MAAAKNAVNWEEYFRSIQSVCPWSWSAWRQGNIDIVNWGTDITELGTHSARLYITHRHNARQLKKISGRLSRTRPNEEWLWSHPQYKNNSTPVAVFIQQDLATLEHLRKKVSAKGP